MDSSEVKDRSTLVVGWFSFELMGATAGDIIAKDVVCNWLCEIGIEPRVAVVEASSPEEICTSMVCPEDFQNVVFVCGPIADGPPLNIFLDKFPNARKFAINVTLLQERREWNPFDGLIERDSTLLTNPDLTFASPDIKVPVIGVIYVGPQEEYPTQRHAFVEDVVEDVLSAMNAAIIRIDTRLDFNRYGLRNPAQIGSAISKMDTVVTTRLHGSVLALQRGVPPVAIDSISGGSKLSRQMKCIGWPLLIDVDELSAVRLEEAIDFALTEEAKKQARQCALSASKRLFPIKEKFLGFFPSEISLSSQDQG